MGVDDRECTGFLVLRALRIASRYAEQNPNERYAVDLRTFNILEAKRLLTVWRPKLTMDDVKKCDRGDVSPVTAPDAYMLSMSTGGMFGVFAPQLQGYKVLGLHVYHKAVGCPFHVVRGKDGVVVLQTSLVAEAAGRKWGALLPRVRTVHEAEDTIPGFVASAFLDDVSDEALARPVDPSELVTRSGMCVTATGIVGEPSSGA